jgi:hypothetical protein
MNHLHRSGFDLLVARGGATAATLSLTVVVPAALSPVATDATRGPSHIARRGRGHDHPRSHRCIGMRDESIAATPTNKSARRTSFRS